ncbi:MAG TPA: tetratricopeptide repeat protein [Candidatus Limnocylindrales bacterium]|nr:tetratricopeptide repeat protein [Candidatus Limnocylindrales bacterium]
MLPLFTAVAAVGALAAVGYAAWLFSRDANSGPPRAETPYQRGVHALLAGHRDEALEAFADTVQEDSENIDAYIHLGNLLRERGEGQRALDLHRKLTARGSRTAAQDRAIREALVLDWIAVGRPEEAVAQALAIRERERKNGFGLPLLLEAYEAGGEWDRAFEVRAELSKAKGERDPLALARYRAAIGEICLRGERLDEAMRHFKAALRLDKDHPVALLRLGDIYYETSHPERAMRLWKGLAAAHPDQAHLVLERLEVSYFERGRFGDMAQLYEEMLQRNPRDARILLALARMHVKRDDLPEATRAAREALECDPRSLEARLLLVDIHRRTGDPGRALTEVDALLRHLSGSDHPACPRCGARAEEYWSRCPACLAWTEPA